MIESKELGVVFAENSLEAEWYDLRESTKQAITVLNQRIANAKKDLKRSQREVWQKFQNGAKAAIKSLETSIEIQKELMAFADSKLSKKEKV